MDHFGFSEPKKISLAFVSNLAVAVVVVAAVAAACSPVLLSSLASTSSMMAAADLTGNAAQLLSADHCVMSDNQTIRVMASSQMHKHHSSPVTMTTGPFMLPVSSVRLEKNISDLKSA